MKQFYEIPNEYHEIGKKWAVSKANYEFLDEERKTVLARIASKHE